MVLELWTEEEQRRLRDLRINPARLSRTRLRAVVQHFEQGGTVWGVSDGSPNELHLAKETARKIREHVQAGRLGWVTSDEQAGPAERSITQADPELGPHARELFAFGARFRDRLAVPSVGQSDLVEGRWWQGAGFMRALASEEEATVEQQWGMLLRDAREHPLYPLFYAHLAGHDDVWAALSSALEALSTYVTTLRQADAFIQAAIVERLPELPPTYLPPMATSLLVDAVARAGGYPGLGFNYTPEAVQEGGLTRWRLPLGSWAIGGVDDPNQLMPYAAVHAGLAEELPASAVVRAVAAQLKAAIGAVRAFQATLSPDAVLRRLVQLGRCRACS